MLVVAGCRSRWLLVDEIVQHRRNTEAARRLLMGLLKKQGMLPKQMITDKLRSHGAAKRQIMPNVEHRSHKSLNNRTENSHLPFRKREHIRQGFRSIGSLQHLFHCSLPSATSSFQITQTTRPPKFAITGCKLWLSKNPSAANSPETHRKVINTPVLQTR